MQQYITQDLDDTKHNIKGNIYVVRFSLPLEHDIHYTINVSLYVLQTSQPHTHVMVQCKWEYYGNVCEMIAVGIQYGPDVHRKRLKR